MGVGVGIYVYDVVVKTFYVRRSLSHLLMSSCFPFSLYEYLYFAITAAKSHTKTKIQQTNIHNTSSNAKKRKKRKKHTIRL